LNHWYKTIPAVVLAAILAGTAACTMLAELRSLPDRVGRLETRLDEIETRIQDIEHKLDKISELSGDRIANIGADLDTLASQVRELRGAVDDLSYRVDMQIPSDAGGGSDLDKRLDRMESRLDAVEDLLGASPSLPDTERDAGKGGREDELSAGYREAYRRAYSLYEDGKYDEARVAFDEFLTKHPGADLADNAVFWLGECYYRQGDYKKAAQQYALVFKKYPKGNKVPDAYYKLGLAFWRLGKTDAAVAALREVIDKYPNSYAAPLARRKLGIIEKEQKKKKEKGG